ncbi:hypothetical protein B9Q04_02025 [Candidatus Marsarchaeota G2 archaeon BE_D]|uniref:Uncharacterized protein n=1 Tax=Candidatus Marsarchaeota G2 archaeon BE_D TaxID=1978158 RepID=A0A2R6CE04_9ARCH|nr:MAG: hypothetical protein B9Q04_02025 [Candidatus Marsarchaeota G2 archaeon BE_D]
METCSSDESSLKDTEAFLYGSLIQSRREDHHSLELGRTSPVLREALKFSKKEDISPSWMVGATADHQSLS